MDPQPDALALTIMAAVAVAATVAALCLLNERFKKP